MAVSASTPADVANLALRRIGYRLRVGSLLDGSAAASALLDVFGQTRDEQLRIADWGFAQTTAPAVMTKEAPADYFDTPWSTAFPQPPWKFELEYPADCLKVRALKPSPGFIFNPRPTSNLFGIANDVDKVILANVANALIVYTRRVTDPTKWEVSFTEALSEALARRIEKMLTNTDPSQMRVATEVQSLLVADRVQG